MRQKKPCLLLPSSSKNKGGLAPSNRAYYKREPCFWCFFFKRRVTRFSIALKRSSVWTTVLPFFKRLSSRANSSSQVELYSFLSHARLEKQSPLYPTSNEPTGDLEETKTGSQSNALCSRHYLCWTLPTTLLLRREFLSCASGLPEQNHGSYKTST